MNTSDFVIKRENILSTFFVGWLAFLLTLRINFKHIIIPVIGQLFGILLISLAPILEFREMLPVFETPDGWVYVSLSVIGVIFFVYFLWRFFVALSGVNLLARDVYDNRAIANLSFYISEIQRKKWSYIRFLIGYAIIASIFTAITAGILFLERNFVSYDFWTNLLSFTIIMIQTVVILTYILFSNIAIQGYTYNRIIGFWNTFKKIFSFIKDNFANFSLLSILTIIFSNIIAYLAQAFLSFFIINPLDLYSDNSITIAIRFTVGFIINAFVVVLLQFIYSRFYLNEEENALRI